MKIDANGVFYHVEIVGSGEPLVLLHGFTGSIDTWKMLQKQLAHSFQLIMIDIIGHGNTESPHDFKRYSMKHSVKDMIAIFDQLKLDKVNLLGYSMGGRLALSIAILHPKRVKKLILESSSPGLKTEEERQNRRMSDDALATMIIDKGMEAFIHYWENIPLFASQKTLPQQVKEQIRLGRLKNSPLGLANSLRGMGTGSQPNWWNSLSLVDLPVLLICGKLDMKYCQIADEMNTLLPHSLVKKLEGCGHTIHVEQPKIFGNIVYDFLTEIGYN